MNIKTFTEFISEEIESEGLRDLKWIMANADAIIDFLNTEYDCDSSFEKELGGIAIYPEDEPIDLDEGLKKRFFELFNRNFLDIFPNKVQKEENNIKFILISPFKEGEDIPQIGEE